MTMRALTCGFLSNQNVELMGHPPYSPDLAPNSSFLLVTHIKKKNALSTILAKHNSFAKLIFEVSVKNTNDGPT